MTILFDIYSTQFFIGGGAEYVRRVFFTLLGEIREKKLDVSIVALMDKSIESKSYPDLSTRALENMGVRIADVSVNSLKIIIEHYKVDKVFIGIAQYWSKFDIESIKIPAICVIHDLCDEETQGNHIFDYIYLDNIRDLLLRLLRQKRNKIKSRVVPFIRQAVNNKDFKLVTVSEYSRSSIAYYYSVPVDKINVLYSPERLTNHSMTVENEILKSLVVSNKKYYLMINANRALKNAKKALSAFEKYQQTTGEQSFIVTTGLNDQAYDNHIVLPYLSEGDLDILMRHCYAFVFPSFFEGFGYPPIEAMKYGKPVLASNTTSIPEICGDAPLYFSPFYKSDIFRCFMSLTESNYGDYSKKSLLRYNDVRKKQQTDLRLLIDLIQE